MAVDYTKYYRGYKYMQSLLQDDFTYNYINENLKDGDAGKDVLVGRTNEKVIDMEWVEAIEDTLPYIERAIDQQRRFIKQIENVVKIELARKTGPESVKHLSQHSNFIAKIENDNVIPNKLLVTEREESFAIYENRFLMTLIRRTLKFVADKYTKMKDVPDDVFNDFNVDRNINMHEEKVDFNFKYVREAHETLNDELDAVIDTEELSDFDRIRKIREKLNSFLATPLMQAIAKETEVRPPINQTNMLKKDPNFKKAVDLWYFLDKYQKPGFEIVSEEFKGAMSEDVQQDVYFTMGFEHFMMTMATNPGLRRMLEEKYEEENARLAEEAARPEETRERMLKAQIDAVRREEMAIRLKEIRERDKKIQELTNEVRMLRAQLEQKEKQIQALKATIATLEEEIKQLKDELQFTKLKLLEAEKKIAQLEEENAQLKAKIEELEAHIVELNNTIDELNKRIDILNDRIQVLLQENAAQKAKIEEQEQIIAEQTAQIEDLTRQIAAHVATIAALHKHIDECEAQMEKDSATIKDLTSRNETLVDSLQKERSDRRETEARMNQEFEDEKLAIFNDHAAKIRAMQDDFADKANQAEQKRLDDLSAQQKDYENQIGESRQANINAAAAVSAKHVTEVRSIQKSVDKRVAEAKRNAEKKYMFKAKEIQSIASDRVRKAEERADQAHLSANEGIRAIHSTSDQIHRDYVFGSAVLIGNSLQELVDSGESNVAERVAQMSSSVASVSACRTSRGILVTRCTPSGLKMLKFYKKSADLTVCFPEVHWELSQIEKCPVFITYTGSDELSVPAFEDKVREKGFDDVTVLENKKIKAKGMIAIYFFDQK